jgi:hypothetical protein
MPVVAIAAERRPVIESVSGRTLAANEEIEVKARTDGVVREVGFQEGGDRARWPVGGAMTQVARSWPMRAPCSEASFARVKQLFRTADSQQEFDQAASTFEAARPR